jgi:two-component system response regulator FlrC
MSGARVLVVDDDRCTREIVIRSLERGGYVCVGAGDALEAATRLEHTRFDLLLSDVDMPAVSGLSLARAVRCRWPSLPVVLMSAIPRAREAAQVGARSFLHKPFSPADAVASVRSALT